jgi:hypothetical protein
MTMTRCPRCGNVHACREDTSTDTVSADVGIGAYVVVELDDGEAVSGTLTSVREMGFPTIRVDERLLALDKIKAIRV